VNKEITGSVAAAMMCFHCPLESDTRRLAAELAGSIQQLYRQLQASGEQFEASIWLQGDLGAGKTTLAREILKSLGVEDRIKSPTYALIEEYHIDKTTAAGSLLSELPLLHLDLYRLADPAELEYIGVPEILAGALALIEWPQQGEGWLPVADLLVRIEDQPGGRMFILQAQTITGKKLSSSLSSCF